MKNYGIRTPHVNTHDYERLKNICKYALEHDMPVCREAVSEDDELIGFSFVTLL